MSLIREIEIIEPISAFGDVRTVQLTPVFQGSFEYTVDNTEITTNTVVNGGTVTQANAMAVITSSTTTASTAKLITKQHAKYRPGLGSLMRFTALFTSPIAATEQLIGFADEAGSGQSFKNGFMLGYIGTVFGFHRFQDDTITTVAKANWDDPMDGSGASGMTLDETKLSVYAINFQYLGAGAIKLLIESDTSGRFVVAHKIDYSNSTAVPSVFNPNFHHTMFVDNKGTTDNLILKGASYAYFIEGFTSLSELHQPHQSSGTIEATSVTGEVPILTIRNKSTYQSKTNFIDFVPELLTASIEATSANNLGKVRLVMDTALSGASYSDINTSDSIVDLDSASTAIVGGKELISIQLAGKNDKFIINLTDHKFIINPSSTLTVTGISSNSATIDASILWKELF